MVYYTYHICWTDAAIHYYGVRGSRVTPKDDLWVQYFTSSKYVTQYRREHGDPDVVEVRKEFGDDRAAAILWEGKVLRRVGVVRSKQWLNRYAGTYRGAPGPKNHRWKISKATKGRKRDAEIVNRVNKDPEKIRKTALAHTGMTRTEESKRKMSEKRAAFLTSIGGAQNKGMKLYYDPNDITQTIQCLPEHAPEGWVNGNPKKKGNRPYINANQEIKWWDPAVVDLTSWQEWNPNPAARKSGGGSGG